MMLKQNGLGDFITIAHTLTHTDTTKSLTYNKNLKT